jgi:hypothetical protein
MPHDLYAEIDQTAVDKLLSSTNYPVTVLEKSQSFPGCDNLALEREGSAYKYTDKQVDDLFERTVTSIEQGKRESDHHILEQLYAFACSIIDKCQSALNSASSDYQGPDKNSLQKIVDGGVRSLPANLRAITGDFGVYAWCPHLQVTVRQRPALNLASPRISLQNLRVEGSATGELWVKYPWLSCSHWHCHWVTKCDRVGSITVSIDVAADAHVDLSVQGAKVYGQGAFDRLRLDYWILRDIPLEGIANSALGNRRLLVYDASKLIETVPVLGSKFAIGAIDLPAMGHAIGVGVTLNQVRQISFEDRPAVMSSETEESAHVPA